MIFTGVREVKDSTYREKKTKDLHGGPVVKNPPANAGDMGSVPNPGRSHIPQGN